MLLILMLYCDSILDKLRWVKVISKNKFLLLLFIIFTVVTRKVLITCVTHICGSLYPSVFVLTWTQGAGAHSIRTQTCKEGVWAGWSLHLSEGFNCAALKGVEKTTTVTTCSARARNPVADVTKTGRGSTQKGLCPAVQTPAFSSSCYWQSLTGNQLAKENCLPSPSASITDQIRRGWAWSREPIIYLFGFNDLFLFWVHWVFTAAAHRLSLVTWVGVLLVAELGFPIWWLLLVGTTTSRVWALEQGRVYCIRTKMPHSAIEKKVSESALMQWMQLEPIIQSIIVSQEEKHQYSILRHIYGI